MKKTIFILTAMLIATLSFAQMSEKFIKAMETKIAALDSTKAAEGYIELGNAFERIADAEKNQWLPYYYAAFCHVMAGYLNMGTSFGQNGDKLEMAANKADDLIVKSDNAHKENSESLCIKNMIAGLRIISNPSVNAVKYGPLADEYLQRAKQLDPNNPRAYLLDAQSAMFKPLEWGGGKDVAKKLIDEAIKKFDLFKPESSIHPNWGKERAKTLHDSLSKNN